MIKVHCDGCGTSEDVHVDEHTIFLVKLHQYMDPMWADDKTFTAHLCQNCMETLLNTYFGLSTSIEPQSLKVVGGD